MDPHPKLESKLTKSTQIGPLGPWALWASHWLPEEGLDADAELESRSLMLHADARLGGGEGGTGGGEGGEKGRWRMILICVFSVFEPKSPKRAKSGDTNMQFDM